MAAACTLVAAPAKFDSLKVGSRTFRNVTVIGYNATDLYFTHTKGISNVKLRLLPEDLQKRFEYDPTESAEIERELMNDDKAYYEMLRNELTAQAQKRIRKAQEDASSLETDLANPISERSLIGRTAPKLEVEKWMGERPYTAGKNVLVFFWTTWSKPCQKAIPQLNDLQARFRDHLTVVGISSQNQEDVAEYNGPALEFPSAVEPEGKIAALVAATSVPYSILVNTNGIILYQGHPGALNATNLYPLIVPPPAE